jgi:hypothetical protein
MSTAWQKWKNATAAVSEIVNNNLNSEVSPMDMLDPNSPRVSLEISSARMSLCNSCPELVKLTKQCKKCGCFMAAKTKLEKAVCPLGKW